ncbi:MAG: hypothetical protein A2Y73_09300 [Chloroflexi bacterium RBG_13_56_8]|nr:MAG: hypothetical protein A2Y73_09300 [Chloroflexi bacterium RBG_13_56_8]
MGMVIGMVAFSNLISLALDRFPVATMFFFMGLLIGTVPTVLNMHEDMRPSFGRGLGLVIGILLVVGLRTIEPRAMGASSTLNVSSPGGILYNGITSFIAGGASVTPGLDGSYILLLAQTYEPITAAVAELRKLAISWAVLVPFGVGAVLGMLAFAKVIDTAIKRAPAISYYCVLGLILGSVYGLWPHEPIKSNLLALVLSFVAGLVLARILSRTSKAGKTASSATE